MVHRRKFGDQCLSWVKTGKAQSEQMFSGLPPKADSDLRVNGYTVRHLFMDRYSLGKRTALMDLKSP
jgi:hypothetical protein